MSASLQINSIYESIQGESTQSGRRCVFIRTTGCPLRCKWCDTAYAFHGGRCMTLDEILDEVNGYESKLVEITGGEPLAQRATFELCDQLIDHQKEVMIETSGSLDIANLNSEVRIIMDIKCPDSGMSSHNRLKNLDYLKSTDEVKFVVASHADFMWAEQFIADYDLIGRFTVLVSVAFGLVKPAQLCEWILASSMDMRVNLQIHKFIWHPRSQNV